MVTAANNSRPSPRVLDLRSQLPPGLVGIDSSPVRLSWKVSSEAGSVQDGYEMEAATATDFSEVLATTGPIESSEQIGMAAPGDPLRSREVRCYRVRVSVESVWGEWSDPLQIEAGLLHPTDWSAEAITLGGDPGSTRQAPSPILRREFTVDGEPTRARLYLSSLGLHQVAINGEPVSDELLAPGWTTYRHRLLAATHDVTALLATGPNVITATLADGWYRGRLGWDPDDSRCRYGEDLGLIAQLEVELAGGGDVRIVSDGTWRASTGEVLMADIYDGSLIDLGARPVGWELPGYDDSAWAPADTVSVDASVLSPRMVAPVRVVDSWVPKELHEVDGELLLNGDQNIAGFVRVEVEGTEGDRVKVRHAEVLEPDGSLHTRSLRTARATDEYVLGSSGRAELEPAFTFHGFRFAGIESEARILSAEFVAISTDLARRGSFDCSDALLNKLHQNVVWSQRDNFVSVPTDCPQRDERLGWTGDAQAFAATACTLFDCEAFWSSWLEDLALDQDPVLGVSTVVPDVALEDEPRYGRAGWADASNIVPWAVYESYGDLEVLRRQFESMVGWVESLEGRRRPDGLLEPGMQFGDWLDPDAPSDRPWEAKTESDFLANAFFAHSARLAADAGSLIRAPGAVVERLQGIGEEVSRLTWEEWSDHIVETQTGCSISLRFGIVPHEERSRVAATLAEMVRAANGRVATGFLGTPHVLHALAEHRYFDEAYSMLMRRQHPSWLYQVLHGATTVWERWDAIRADGTIHPGTMAPPPGMSEEDSGGHMLSFNHYAYGAVVDWMYRYLAGIAPDRDRPGYRHVVMSPRPVAGVDWAQASVATGYGMTKIGWEIEGDGDLVVEATIPFGATATLTAPVTAGSRVSIGGESTDPVTVLGPGHHRVIISQPLIVGT